MVRVRSSAGCFYTRTGLAARPLFLLVLLIAGIVASAVHAGTVEHTTSSVQLATTNLVPTSSDHISSDAPGNAQHDGGSKSCSQAAGCCFGTACFPLAGHATTPTFYSFARALHLLPLLEQAVEPSGSPDLFRPPII
jgi:hypothetical protein